MFNRCFWIASVFAAWVPLQAADLHVAPSGAPYTTIQAAIDAAAVGDRVLIAEGTYSSMNSHAAPAGYSGAATIHQIVYVEKSIYIGGGYDLTFTTPDPAQHPTVIDAFNQGRCLFVNDADPVIQGCRFINGNANGEGGTSWTDAGGGIYSFGGSPIFLECSVTDCQAGAGGGAFMANCGFFNLLRVQFVNNTCTNMGGGLNLLGSNGYIESSLFNANSAGRMGGAIYISYSRPELAMCEIRNNTATEYAGGLVLYDTSAHIVESTFTNNNGGDGGAIWSSISDASIERNTIAGNTAAYSGGGIYIEDGNDSLVNNIIAMNQVTATAGEGAGILCAGGDVTLIHNTIASNTGGSGSGIELTTSLTAHAIVNMNNTIVSEQTIGILVDAGSSATFDSILFHDATWDWGGTGTVHPGVNLFHGDPRFVDAAGLDFHIQSTSAAHDAGHDAGVLWDMDGQLRPWDAGFDIGADEYRYIPTRGVWITCPLFVHPGEGFFVTGYLENDGGVLPGTYVFFLLDVAGQYWFWPGWKQYSPSNPSTLDYQILDVASGKTTLYVLNTFVWPDTGSSTMTDIRFWGAMVDPLTMQLIGELAMVEWGFGP